MSDEWTVSREVCFLCNAATSRMCHLTRTKVQFFHHVVLARACGRKDTSLPLEFIVKTFQVGLRQRKHKAKIENRCSKLRRISFGGVIHVQAQMDSRLAGLSVAVRVGTRAGGSSGRKKNPQWSSAFLLFFFWQHLQETTLLCGEGGSEWSSGQYTQQPCSSKCFVGLFWELFPVGPSAWVCRIN